MVAMATKDKDLPGLCCLFPLLRFNCVCCSGVDGESRQSHHSSLVTVTDRNGPHEGRPSDVHSGKAIAAGDVLRLLCSSGSLCRVGLLVFRFSSSVDRNIPCGEGTLR